MGTLTRLADVLAPPTDEEVRPFAYNRWLRRGCPKGDADRDWFAAKASFEAAQEFVALMLFGAVMCVVSRETDV